MYPDQLDSNYLHFYKRGISKNECTAYAYTEGVGGQGGGDRGADPPEKSQKYMVS